MTLSVRVDNLVVGDLFAGGDAEVTMLGASSSRTGKTFIGFKSGGRAFGTSLSPDAVVQIDTRFRA